MHAFRSRLLGMHSRPRPPAPPNPTTSGVDVACDGTVPFRSGERISFSYLVSRKYTGETAQLRVLRGGAVRSVAATLGAPHRLVPVHIEGRPPPYFIFGGLVFTQVTVPYLRSEYGKDYDFDAPARLRRGGVGRVVGGAGGGWDGRLTPAPPSTPTAAHPHPLPPLHPSLSGQAAGPHDARPGRPRGAAGRRAGPGPGVGRVPGHRGRGQHTGTTGWAWGGGGRRRGMLALASPDPGVPPLAPTPWPPPPPRVRRLRCSRSTAPPSTTWPAWWPRWRGAGTSLFASTWSTTRRGGLGGFWGRGCASGRADARCIPPTSAHSPPALPPPPTAHHPGDGGRPPGDGRHLGHPLHPARPLGRPARMCRRWGWGWRRRRRRRPGARWTAAQGGGGGRGQGRQGVRERFSCPHTLAPGAAWRVHHA